MQYPHPQLVYITLLGHTGHSYEVTESATGPEF